MDIVLQFGKFKDQKLNDIIDKEVNYCINLYRKLLEKQSNKHEEDIFKFLDLYYNKINKFASNKPSNKETKSNKYDISVNLSVITTSNLDDIEYVDNSQYPIVAIFKNHESHLIKLIKECDAIIGCVAWLKNHKILNAMESRDVSIIIQKEDYLNRDSVNYDSKLMDKYNKLKGIKLINITKQSMYDNEIIVSNVESTSHDHAIHVLGVCGGDKHTARMHNKFVLFCKYENNKRIPYAVWTGSYNFTNMANLSMENAVVLYDPKIVKRYEECFYDIFLSCEPINYSVTLSNKNMNKVYDLSLI